MFRQMVTNWHLSKAAVVAQNLLAMHGAGTEVAPIASQLSNKLVQKIYDGCPGLFDGTEGARPHKFSVAAMALAFGVKNMTEHSEAQRVMFLGVGTILLEIKNKPNLYPLSSQDHRLLVRAEDIYLANLP